MFRRPPVGLRGAASGELLPGCRSSRAVQIAENPIAGDAHRLKQVDILLDKRNLPVSQASNQRDGFLKAR
jgi:hypothetical protein